ncbi:MAG: glycyl-radical enzyme activating protein [Bacteroidota bacterium]
MEGLLFDIRRYSVHDGPGIRTTVFFKGCPLHCLWCHNPEGISREPQPILRNRPIDGRDCLVRDKAGKWYMSNEVMRDVESDRLFFEESGGGVTFSGGEPLMQPLFLMELIALCKSSGIHIAIDTSGHAPNEIFKRATSVADLLLFDIKTTNRELHQEFTGESNELILENFLSLEKEGPPVWVRIPVIPGFNDNTQEIQTIAKLLKSSSANIKAVHLLPYHQLGRQKYEALQMQLPPVFKPPISDAKATRFLSIFNQAGFSAKTGG